MTLTLGNTFISIDHVAGSTILTIAGRTIHLCRDYVERNRTPKLIEFHAGESAGHWEVLVLRRWLLQVEGSEVDR